MQRLAVGFIFLNFFSFFFRVGVGSFFLLLLLLDTPVKRSHEMRESGYKWT